MLLATDILGMSGFGGFLLGLLVWGGPLLAMVIAWRCLRVKPARLMIWSGFAWLGVGILGSVFAEVEKAWWLMLFIWGGAALLDLLILLLVKQPEVERELPGRFAMGIENTVELTVRNRSSLPLQVTVYDGLPEEGACEGLPWVGSLPRQGYRKISFPVVLNVRGDSRFEAAHLQLGSLFHFWVRQMRVGPEQETKVYLNYEPVVRFALLTMESRPEQMGIVMKNRAGLSKDFHQLRDYHLGDMLSQIDWKATSKRLSLISRDYQEQRDQNVILAVDCGRRMRAMDGGVPQFDHCLNAMLLLAYVALKQGDHVGIMGFGGEDKWLPPVKGVNSMTTILNHLYDYQTTTSPSDYSEAMEKLMARQRRRALVVMISNVRGEDGIELVEPLRMMRRRHVVMLANLREKEVMDQMNDPVRTLDDALTMGATQRYLDERRLVLKELNGYGVQTVDATAQELPVALANRYLAAREMV